MTAVFGRVGPSLWSPTQLGWPLAEPDGSVALTVEGDRVGGVHARCGLEDLGKDVHERRALLRRKVLDEEPLHLAHTRQELIGESSALIGDLHEHAAPVV